MSRAPWQGWSRMNVTVNVQFAYLGIYEVVFSVFRHKIPRTLNHPKALPYTIYLRSFSTVFPVTCCIPTLSDVRSNGLHTAHLWCEIQLPGPVERYGQTGPAGAAQRRDEREEAIGRRFDKARSLQYSWSMAILRKFFFSSSLSDYARSTGWLRQELDTKRSEFSAGSRGCMDDLSSNLKLLNLYATRETDYIGLRSMHASSQTVKSWHLRPIKQNTTTCQDDQTVC